MFSSLKLQAASEEQRLIDPPTAYTSQTAPFSTYFHNHLKRETLFLVEEPPRNGAAIGRVDILKHATAPPEMRRLSISGFILSQ